MNHSYLVLPHLVVQNANAQPTAWIIGPPPVTAYAGFAHALALAIGAERHYGVAIVHHDIQYLAEVSDRGVLNPHQYRTVSFIDQDDYAGSCNKALGQKARPVMSTQPTVRCHLEVSMAIRFDAEEMMDLQKVTTFLRGARLAGGNITEHRFDVNKKQCVIPDGADVKTVIRALGGGFAVHERQDLMVMRPGDRDMLDAMLRATKMPGKGKKGDGWIMPTSLGYAQVSDVEQRPDTREGLPHAFAEPLVGLVQYVPLRNKDELPFWRYKCPAPGVFAVTTL